MQYKVIIKSYLECKGIKENDMYELDIRFEEKENNLLIFQEIPTEFNNEMDRLNKMVSEVIYDKRDYSIVNVDDLINKWKKEKKDIIFNEGGEAYVTSLMSISKYLETSETLTFFIKNYGITPILLLAEANKELDEELVIKDFELFNLFYMGKALFNIKLEVDNYRGNRIFKVIGEPSEKYDIVNYKNEVKKKFKFSLDEQLNLKVKLHGQYKYEMEKLSDLLFNAVIDIKEGYSMGYSIEFKKAKGEVNV